MEDLFGDAAVSGLITASQEGNPVASAVVRFIRGNAFREATTNQLGSSPSPTSPPALTASA